MQDMQQEFGQTLSEIVANIEERTNAELSIALKESLIRAGTGTPIDTLNEQYKVIYRELQSRLSTRGEDYPNPHEDLWEFYSYWKANDMQTYQSRRDYVASLYNKAVTKDQADFWGNIHEVIKEVARKRFTSGEYADSVEASYKEINHRVKEFLRQKTGEELDGAPLMNKVFSPNNPIIMLDDITTEQGRNVQQGYMQMLAGAMIGIRNPRAHSNEQMDKAEAVPLVQFASHLYTRVEKGMANSSPVLPEEKATEKKLYVWIKEPNDTKTLMNIRSTIREHEGSNSIILVLGSKRESAIRLPMQVKIGDSLIKLLKDIVGEGNVRVQ